MTDTEALAVPESQALARVVSKREEIALAITEATDAWQLVKLSDEAQRASVAAALLGYEAESKRLAKWAHSAKRKLHQMLPKPPHGGDRSKPAVEQEGAAPPLAQASDAEDSGPVEPPPTLPDETRKVHSRLSDAEYEAACAYADMYEDGVLSDRLFDFYADLLKWRRKDFAEKLTGAEFEAVIDRAHAEMKRRPQRADFKRAWDKKRQAAAKAARLAHERREAAMDVEWKPQLLHATVEDIADYIEPHSVDVIFTDPLYEADALGPVWSNLPELALRVLKPNGLLIAMSGQKFLPRVFAALEHPDLRYMWTLCHGPFKSPQQFWHPPVWPTWKPVVIYQVAPFDEWQSFVYDMIGDDLGTVGNRDEEKHEFGQDDIGVYNLMKPFVRKGMTVLDCCVGGGSTGIACRALGAHFIGGDSSESALEKARERIGA